MKPRPVATLVGDAIGSRTTSDRPRLHRLLAERLDDVNARLTPYRPLRMTVGDEYQGSFRALGDALRATLLLRVGLAPEHDVRHGLGWGPTAVLDEAGGIEDGPGWWAARAGIEAVEEAEAGARARWLRTVFRRAPDYEGPEPAAINAALILRDERVSGLSDRSLSVLRGLLSGETQRDIADELGISASAVSQRVRSDGLAAVVAAHDLMGEVR